MKGTVSKRPRRKGRPRWAYVFDVGKDPASGKRKQITKSGFASKREAQDALSKAMAEHQNSPAAKAKPMPTFREFFGRYYTEVILRNHGEKTSERDEDFARYAIRRFGDAPLDQLSPEQLTKDVNWLIDHGGRTTKAHPQGRPLSPTTVRHIAFGVQACLEQAVDWDIIPKNPMKKVKKPKRVKRDPPVVGDDALARLLTGIAGTALYTPVVVDHSTGMRRGELCGLEWTDLDWERRVLSVTKSLGQRRDGTVYVKSTKSTKPRRFTIPADVVEVLRDHFKEQQADRALFGTGYQDLNLIFARPDGYYYSPKHLSTRVSAAMRLAGIPKGISLHSLRHTHASQMLSEGAPITAVSERLGHANANITLGIYAHALPKDDGAVAQLWNNAMSSMLEASRKQARARRCIRLANVSAGKEKIRVIPIKSAS
jgi:integrase